MTAAEAIKRLEQHTFKATSEPGREYNNALKLGIEALTLVGRCRGRGPVWLPRLLPGETGD